MLNIYAFIQVYVFTSNHHLNTNFEMCWQTFNRSMAHKGITGANMNFLGVSL